MLTKLVKKAGVLGAVVLMVASCSSSSKTSTGSATTAPRAPGSSSATANNTASAPGITPTTIKLGLLTSVTGAASSTFAPTSEGAQARISVENDKGGVNGRKIELVTADDASTPTQNLTAAQDLVESKGSFAVMAVTSFLFGGYRYLNQQGIPVTGAGPTGGPEWGQQPNTNMFAFLGGLDAHTPATTFDGAFLKSVGATNVAVFAYGSSPASIASIKQEVSSDKAAGLQVGYENLSIPFGGVDFTAAALAMKNAKVDAAVGSFVEASDIALTNAIKQAGMNLKAQLYYTGYDQALLDQPSAASSAQGDYFRSSWPAFEAHIPASDALIAALKKYDSSYKGGIPNLGLMDGWLSADLMIKGLQVAGQNPTRQSFVTNLTQVTGYDGGGLLPSPVSFNHFGTYDPKQCAYFVQLKGAQFVPVPADGTPICGTVIPNSNTA